MLAPRGLVTIALSGHGPFFASFDTFSSFFAQKISEVIRGARLAR
jgi:hypothetical protein